MNSLVLRQNNSNKAFWTHHASYASDICYVTTKHTKNLMLSTLQLWYAISLYFEKTCTQVTSVICCLTLLWKNLHANYASHICYVTTKHTKNLMLSTLQLWYAISLYFEKLICKLCKSHLLCYYKTHEKLNIVNVATLICHLTLLSKACMQVMQVTYLMLVQNTRKTQCCQRPNN